ncbi:MAG: calcium/sodium antiporter [Brumimicrobium sp.]|nr:calcium/sodium antiporter [Brumimicrobium sp.]
MIFEIILIIVGLTALIVGGEFLVRGAVGIAAKARLSKLVIGMTVVSFGTSAPELIVSLQSAADGLPEIAIGNVVGSNIANLALVLGLTVLIFPMPVALNTIKYDWPMMVLISAVFYLFALNLNLNRWEGVVIFLSLIAFVVFLIINSRKQEKLGDIDSPEINKMAVRISVWKHLAFLGIGLVGLYFGANWLIDGAKGLAERAGLSAHVIGITVVAFGTSVPELVTSCVAAFRKETDISVGNLIGSNIFNIGAVLGITSMVEPIEIAKNVLSWDIFWMLGVALILLPMMVFRKKIGRISGVILMGSYVFYIISLF